MVTTSFSFLNKTHSQQEILVNGLPIYIAQLKNLESQRVTSWKCNIEAISPFHIITLPYYAENVSGVIKLILLYLTKSHFFKGVKSHASLNDGIVF
jgi:hypothetical protein